MGLGTAVQPLRIWVVTDGRAGNEVQALGLAEAVARLTPAEIETKRIAYRGRMGRLPWWANPAPQASLTPASGIAPPWPDLWIGAGRASVALSRRARAWSSGRTFVVQLHSPHAPLRDFDLVIPPRHDGLSGRNVLPITGSPHRVTPGKLAAEFDAFRATLEPLPHPRVAVLIGGASKAFDLPAGHARQLAEEVAAAVRAAGGSVLVTFSRRTPGEAQAAMAPVFAALPGTVWDGTGPNPYFAFLAAADHILVTEDSANMATEACATGKPVHLLRLVGESPKLARLHADLAAAGALRPFDGRLEGQAYPPLDETTRAAAEVVRRLGLRQAALG